MKRRSVAAVEPAEAVLFKQVRLFDGGTFAEGEIDVAVLLGRIAAVDESLSLTGPDVAGVNGGWLFPGFVDAHVHLSFSDADEVASGSVTGVLDLGAPLPYSFSPHPPLRYATSGPLITARRGYPTTSWGSNGYGLEIDDPRQARDAVDLLAASGAAIVKVALEPRGGTMLDAASLRAVVEAAHGRGLLVAAHALEAEQVRDALGAGVDALAHTPIELLPDELTRALGDAGVIVVSTMRAFGAGREARENLAALAAAGCPIAYGTDLGNGAIRPGIDPEELTIIEETLGDRERALAAATSVSGGLAGVGGRIVQDAPADLVWVPRFDSFADLRRDARIWIGER